MAAPDSKIIGRGPAFVAKVFPLLRSMVAWRTRVSEIDERSTTSPFGFIIALKPVGAA